MKTSQNPEQTKAPFSIKRRQTLAAATILTKEKSD